MLPSFVNASARITHNILHMHHTLACITHASSFSEWLVSAIVMTADICQLQLLTLQHDISNTLQIAQDVLHMGQLDHEIEEVPDQEWVKAMKVCFCSPSYLILSQHHNMHT